MDRQEFADHMLALWDAGDRITISVPTKTYRTRRKGVPTEDTRALARRLGEILKEKKEPFRYPVVATKDILYLPEFANETAARVGRALKEIGAEKGGQVRDNAGEMTRVWIVAKHDELVNAPPSRIEYVYRRSVD